MIEIIIKTDKAICGGHKQDKGITLEGLNLTDENIVTESINILLNLLVLMGIPKQKVVKDVIKYMMKNES